MEECSRDGFSAGIDRASWHLNKGRGVPLECHSNATHRYARYKGRTGSKSGLDTTSISSPPGLLSPLS